MTSRHYIQRASACVNNHRKATASGARNGNRPSPKFATDCQVTELLFLSQARLGESMKITGFWLWAVVVAFSYHAQGKAERGL